MSAQPCATPKYVRRRPELTPCYQVLQGHLNTFMAERQAENRPLPDYVVAEFEAYLRCGILAHGFLRLQCGDCKKEHVVAFSCKKRGFCPSCCGKRMAEAAAHLEEHVLPRVAYRQFVVSFPIPLRYWLQTNRKLFSKVHSLVITELHRYYREKAAGLGIKDSTPGSIAFTQRWGSALNLNPHLHVLCPDGVYTRVRGLARFRNIDPITDQEVATLVECIALRVMGYLQKKGFIDKDGDIVVNPTLDELFQDSETLSLATSCSIAGKIAFGPNAGRYVTRIGSGFGYWEEIPLAKGSRCYSIHGFSLHANTAVATLQRDRLAKLIEYIARGPLANERLEITDDGKVKLRLKSQWADGTTHLLFSPTEFIEKLSALIPPPRSHLVRWGGVFAPNSPYRKEITLKPEVKKGFQFEETEGGKTYKNRTWSKMLARVFKIDVMVCPDCGGHMRALCSIKDPFSIRRYLQHLNIAYEPPPRAPPRYSWGSFDFEQPQVDEQEPVIHLD